jgi:hypothetical protein
VDLSWEFPRLLRDFSHLKPKMSLLPGNSKLEYGILLTFRWLPGFAEIILFDNVVH